MLFHCKHNPRCDVATVVRLATRSLGVPDVLSKCMYIILFKGELCACRAFVISVTSSISVCDTQ